MNEIEMHDVKDMNNKESLKRRTSSVYVTEIEYRHIYAGKVNMPSAMFFFYILRAIYWVFFFFDNLMKLVRRMLLF